VTNLVTYQEFLALDTVDKKDYLLQNLQLEDFWVIGTINNSSEEKPFFFIKNTMNPYTGLEMSENIFTFDINNPDVSLDIFCVLPQNKLRFDEGVRIAAKIRMSDKKNLTIGKLFTTSYKDIYPIESDETLHELLGTSEFDLPIIALAKPRFYDNAQRSFSQVDTILKTKLTNELTLIQQERTNMEKKIEEAKKQAQVLEEQQIALAKTQQELTALSTKLHELGFSVDVRKELEEQKNFLPKPENFSSLLKEIQLQLKVRGYHYGQSFIRRLLLALTTGQMLILTGPSGTGKTSIIKQLADVIDASYEIIPVQPSWTDKQDLLGFYNPIRKLYVPSPFLDCLIKAQQQPEKLFFICLDEMNLAQIEYYLADVLSIRELEDGRLRLYSDFEYEQNTTELKWFVQKIMNNDMPLEQVLQEMQGDTLAHFDMMTRYKNLQRYQPEISIPANVRIIGTMNVDGAVQAISPKIVDRSFVIPVGKQEKVDGQVSDIGVFDITVADMSLLKQKTEQLSPELLSDITEIQKRLTPLQIEYNARVEKHMLQYYKAAMKFEVPTKQQVDDLTVMKILPRIHTEVENPQIISDLLQTVSVYTDTNATSVRKIENMKQKTEQIGLFSYWS
jgi:energy-coupling factor transporter ATP-binding protein EcfA2